MKENREALALGALGFAKGIYEEARLCEPSVKAIGAIGAFVVGYDVLCPKNQTISEGWDKVVEKHPILARAIPLYITAHVINAIPKPEKYDIIHRMSRMVDKK